MLQLIKVHHRPATLRILVLLIFNCIPLHFLAQSPTTSRVDRAIASAKQTGESEVRLPDAHRDPPRIQALNQLLYRHIPLIVNVTACRPAIRPVTNDSVLTYCVMAVQKNVLGKELPHEIRSTVSADIRALVPTDGVHILVSLPGGSVSVNGVRVFTTPEIHELKEGNTYLVFVSFAPSGVGFIFDNDHGALQLITATDSSRLSFVKTPTPAALQPFDGIQVSAAVALLERTVPAP